MDAKQGDELVDRGSPGAGAQREYERRRANRENRIRAENPRTAKLRLALGEAPQHERAWASGARGEVLVAESLEARAGEHAVLLHDRRIPGRRGNIDHLAIAPTGVWVIDAKNLKGRVRIEKSFRREPRLIIGGRDQTKLIDNLDRQVEAVRRRLPPAFDRVPVHGALCFIETDLPTFRTLTCRGYPLLWRKGMARRLRADGPFDTTTINQLARHLAGMFSSA